MPMHTFGFPCRIDDIIQIAVSYNIPVIEDAAESLGSWYKNRHTGTFGLAGIFSYNGNKTITTGGGGMIITDNSELARRAKHITTTAKIPHKYEYIHDEIAYNYRLTNVDAAIGVAQMEQIERYLKNKRETAKLYRQFFEDKAIKYFAEPENARANYWLNTILFSDSEKKTQFLEYTNEHGIMTRPVWRLMNKLDMYKNCQSGNLENCDWFEKRIVNLPSSVRK